MENSTKEVQCRVKRQWPDYKSYFTFTGNNLPSPLIEWKDFYYQSMGDVAEKIENDFKYVEKLLKRRNRNVDE